MCRYPISSPSSPTTGNRENPVSAQIASTSVARAPRLTVCSALVGSSTSLTVREVNPSAPDSRSYSLSSSSPSARDSSTRASTSSRVKVEVTSLRGSTRRSRTIRRPRGR